MPDKLKYLYGGLLALCIADDFLMRKQATKFARMFLEDHAVHEEVKAHQEAQLRYLCHLLNEHGIEVDEFDLIALNFNTE